MSASRPVRMARVIESVNGRGSPGLMFLCHGCDEPLAALSDWRDGHDWAFLNSLLIRLPHDRDDMPAYGLPKRMLKGHTRRLPSGPIQERPRWQRKRYQELREQGKDVRWHRIPRGEQPWMSLHTRSRLPIIAYCPRQGVCGRANQIDMRPVREWMRNNAA